MGQWVGWHAYRLVGWPFTILGVVFGSVLSVMSTD